MTLTVEDGTGLAAADAFVSVAGCDTYHTNKGNSTWTGTGAVKEVAIRRATAWLSDHFTWKGDLVNGRTQALAWPRYGVVDRNGWSVASDSLPRELVDATCEAALRELVTPGTLTPDVTMTDRVKSEKVSSIAVEYFPAPGSADASRPVVTAIFDMLRGLIKGGGGLSGKAVRG